MDNAAEIALTVGAAVAAALFLAYHHGKVTTTTTQQNIQLPPNQPPPLTAVSGDAANEAAAYNPANDIPNSFTLDQLGNIVITKKTTIFNIPAGELVPLNNIITITQPWSGGPDFNPPIPIDNQIVTLVQNLTTINNTPNRPVPVNMSNGTPQCGCSQNDFSTLDAIAAAQSAAYAKTLAAISAIKPVEPASNIYVTVQRPAQQFNDNINLASQKSYDVVGALGDVVTHFLGYNP